MAKIRQKDLLSRVYIEIKLKQGDEDLAIWKQTMFIKGEETCELQITEKEGEGKISRKVVIKNGRVIEKPADVNILGDSTPDGFIISGLEIVRKRKIRDIHVDKGKR